MKEIKSILFLLIFSVNISAQSVYNWENPAIFRVNNEPAHASFLPYADLESAMTFDRSGSEFYKSLNGIWKFKYLKNPLELLTAFIPHPSMMPHGIK